MAQPVRFGLNVDPNSGGLPIAERITAVADTNGLEYVGVQDHPYNSGFEQVVPAVRQALAGAGREPPDSGG